jgi:two-component system, NtrC family, sensor kinase
VLIYDTSMNVQRVNSMFIPTYGFDPVSLNVREVIQRTRCRWSDGRPFRFEDLPTPRALHGETVVNQRFLITRPDGVEMALETSSGPLRLGDEIIGTVTVWHDITESRRMEDELLRSRDELEVRVQERTAELQVTNRAFKEYAVKLERLNEELRDFAFIASHDLQEPVRKIQVLGDMLVRKCGSYLDEGGQDCVMRMARSARQMGALIQSLLEYSRVTTRFGPMELVDLSRVVQEIIDEIKPAVESIDGQIEVGTLPIIEADAAQMRHIFQHLIENAIKFSKEDEAPVIKVYGQGAKDHFKIIVEDNGIGFDEGYLDRIFRPFQQLHERKGQYDGTGMGLAVCRKIVELHGGTITARSTSGVGSVFTVSLPITSSREGLL